MPVNSVSVLSQLVYSVSLSTIRLTLQNTVAASKVTVENDLQHPQTCICAWFDGLPGVMCKS